MAAAVNPTQRLELAEAALQQALPLLEQTLADEVESAKPGNVATEDVTFDMLDADLRDHCVELAVAIDACKLALGAD